MTRLDPHPFRPAPILTRYPNPSDPPNLPGLIFRIPQQAERPNKTLTHTHTFTTLTKNTHTLLFHYLSFLLSFGLSHLIFVSFIPYFTLQTITFYLHTIWISPVFLTHRFYLIRWRYLVDRSSDQDFRFISNGFVALMTVVSSSMSLAVSTLQGGFQQSESAAFDPSMDAIYDPSSNSNLEIDENDIDLLSVSWNQDYGCFAAGTNHGFRIYNCDPFKETFRRDLKSGGFGIIEMLFRSNILALVGGKGNTQYPPNKVIIWDDHQSRCIGEFSFRSDVRAVKLRRDRIVVVLEHKIYVYNFMDLKLLHQIETMANPRGLCCLSHQVNTSVLACPGLRRGQVRVEHFGLNMTKLINAHDSRISCLTMTMDGLLLATASTKGTLIRIFNTMDGTRLQEVRRGVDRADIYGISLSPNVQWLAVSSDKGTVHIFSLRVRVGSEDSSTQSTAHTPSLSHQNSSSSLDGLISPSAAGANPGSSLSFMKGVLPKYFSSEWSFARFHLPECTQYMSAFGSQNTLIIVGMDGSFYRCIFDPVNGGEMVQHEYVRFLKTELKHR